MKNKILAMSLAALFALGAVACGGDGADDAGDDAGTTSEAGEVTS